MRLIVMYDLPTTTKSSKREYIKFSRFLKSRGFIRMQYSIYVKLCMNTSTLRSEKIEVLYNVPKEGDVRLLQISESQYQGIFQALGNKSNDEAFATTERMIIIGDED